MAVKKQSFAERLNKHHETVANRLIQQLKEGTAPWQRPWLPGEESMPMNPTTGKRYKGINSIFLLSQGRSDPRWMTYKQAEAIDAQVRKGEKGTVIQYVKFTELQTKLDGNGKPVFDDDGNPVKVSVELERPRVYLAAVFNGEQIDGLPPLELKSVQWNAHERAEHILSTSGAIIQHAEGNRAFYRPTTDSIHLPDKGQFPTSDSYYATALHELGHWTGHPSRQDRDLAHPFGSEGYAREELRAEIASMLVGEELNIGHDPGQHAAYVQSWIKALEDDPREIFRASTDAEKIQEFVLSFDQKQVQEHDQQQEAAVHNIPATDADTLRVEAWMLHHVQNYINVPYREKDEAKSLGARWDRQKQSWYVPPGVDNDLFSKWTQQASQSAAAPSTPSDTAQTQNAAQRRLYLAVPYGERGAAKAAGAKWDKAAKSWYVGPSADMDKLQRWLPENVQDQQGPAMTPREEFAEALTSLGCVLTGDHPIMDGQKHRIGAEGDKKGEQAGFYVGHLDGHPAGYIKNNRTGIDMKWKSKGYSLNPQEKAKLQAEAANKLAARQAERDRLQETIAQRVSLQMESLVPASVPTPYMLTKRIRTHAGAMTDKEGQKTYIPATDSDGKQWTMQYIQEDGTKRFAKNSRKEGCFHAVGGIEAIAAAPALVISEGYATADTLAEALGHGTIAAFDSGNLLAVAQALHKKFPNLPVIIAGDDDQHLEVTQGINSGKVKALEAAKAVGGKAIFPVFAPGEASYPASLDPITPKSYRNHQRVLKTLKDQPGLSASAKEELRLSLLDADQLAALDKMKQHTDFNDLATRSELGKEGVLRQVSTSVAQVIDTAPRTVAFDSLSPDNQELAKTRFMNSGEKDGYRYELDRDGQVLSRQKDEQLKRSQQQDSKQRRSARM